MATDYKRYVQTIEVEARQLDEDESVVTAGGVQPASKGDYVVKDAAGAVRVVSADDFNDAYSAAGSTSSSSKGDDSKAS